MNRLLLIANYDYINTALSLSGIEDEVKTIKDKFELMQYKIEIILNIKYEEIRSKVECFLKKISKEDTAIIYYTGHGCYYDGRNFIVCVDSSTSVDKNIDSSYYEDMYKLYDLCRITDYEYKSNNVLLVCNACRTKSTSGLGEPVFENKFSGSKNIIAQIYATALGNSAYTTTYFYQNFCDACFRYKHSVSDIYESICCKKNDVDKRYMQNPVFIKGENEFCISNTLNKDVERQIYQDIIDIYNDYVNCKINECDKYKKISEILYEENYELAKIGGPKKYVINIMENYCLRECKYQFISCLLRLPIYTAVIREKSFRLHSKCGWYEFKNTNLYDFEQCEEALENDCREVYNGIKLLLDHIFYINVHEALVLSVAMILGAAVPVAAEPVSAGQGVEAEQQPIVENSITSGYILSDLDYNTPVYEQDEAVPYSDDWGYSADETIENKYPANGVSDIKAKYPSVRNQNPLGTCWTFSSIGLAEFDLINDGAFDKNIDLSELHLAYYAYNSLLDPLGGTVGDYAKYYMNNTSVQYGYLNRGGNYLMAARRMGQWCGPVSESDVPYSKVASNGYTASTIDTFLNTGLSDEYAYSKDKAHLENTYMINIKENASDVKKP